MNKLCLGTVQLGMHYGINNAIGRMPTKDESYSILDSAFKFKIKTVDTAAAYGCAEEILGEFGVPKNDVSVISKLMPNIFVDIHGEKYIDIIEEEMTSGKPKKSVVRIAYENMKSIASKVPQAVEFAAAIAQIAGVLQQFGVLRI